MTRASIIDCHGHFFGSDLRCENRRRKRLRTPKRGWHHAYVGVRCGRSWYEHQDDPQPCAYELLDTSATGAIGGRPQEAKG